MYPHSAIIQPHLLSRLQKFFLRKCSPYFLFFFAIWVVIIKGGIQFSAAQHFEEPLGPSCLLRKVSRTNCFFFKYISVQINVSATINMQTKGSIKSLPCRGLLLLFYEVGGNCKMNIEMALKSRSYNLDLNRVKLSSGIFFSERFNGDFFITIIQDLYFFCCQKDTPKIRKFKVLSDFNLWHRFLCGYLECNIFILELPSECLFSQLKKKNCCWILLICPRKQQCARSGKTTVTFQSNV